MMGCPSSNDINLLDLVGCHNNENGWLLVEWFWSELHVLPFVNINFRVTAVWGFLNAGTPILPGDQLIFYGSSF